jgi:hypothetical protein
MRKGAYRYLPERREGKRQEKANQRLAGALPHDRPRTYSEDGVDLTLVHWMLSISPAERLQVLQENVGAILRLRREETKLPFHTSDASKRTD